MITLIDDIAWSEFLQENPAQTFLQSLAWKHFNEASGHLARVYGQEENGVLKSTCLMIHVIARRGDHLLIPHGPVSSSPLTSDDLKKWKETWKKVAKDLSCNFVRWQPVLPETEEEMKKVRSAGFFKAPIHAHTEHTSVVDISGDDKAILMNMRKTTRQMIRKGDKLIASGEVTVTYPDHISDEMAKVYSDTYVRGGAVGYSTEYIRNEWEAFKKQDSAKLINVYHEGKLLSWGMFIFNGTGAFYHQGGNYLSKKIPSSYVCQWHGMKEARKRGCTSYDFWGVTPSNAKNHPWKNISKFKRGFGGNDVSYIPAHDIPLSLKYWPNWLLETYRAHKRGFK